MWWKFVVMVLLSKTPRRLRGRWWGREMRWRRFEAWLPNVDDIRIRERLEERYRVIMEGEGETPR